MTEAEEHDREAMIAEQGKLILKRAYKSGVTPSELILLLTSIIASIAGNAVKNERKRSDDEVPNQNLEIPQTEI